VLRAPFSRNENKNNYKKAGTYLSGYISAGCFYGELSLIPEYSHVISGPEINFWL